jgi:hypothetical protein
MKAMKAAKSTSEKKLKKVALNPVKNLKMTTAALKIDGVPGESIVKDHPSDNH